MAFSRILVSFPDEMIQALDLQAEKEMMRRSEFLRTIWKEYAISKGIDFALRPGQRVYAPAQNLYKFDTDEV